MNTITLTLPTDVVQYIVNVLGERPHREVRNVIDEIKRQADASSMPPLPPIEPPPGSPAPAEVSTSDLH